MGWDFSNVVYSRIWTPLREYKTGSERHIFRKEEMPSSSNVSPMGKGEDLFDGLIFSRSLICCWIVHRFRGRVSSSASRGRWRVRLFVPMIAYLS